MNYLGKSHTSHFYDVNEVKVAQQCCARMGNMEEKGFWDVEMDLNGLGSDVWNTNLTLAVTDVGIANPALLFCMLLCFNQWGIIVRDKLNGINYLSHTNDQTKKLLLCGSMYITQSIKSQLVTRASIGSLGSCKEELLDQVRNLDDEFLELTQGVLDSVSWRDNLDLRKCHKKFDPREPSSIHGHGLDLKEIMGCITGFMNKTIHCWKLVKNSQDITENQALHDNAVESEKILLLLCQLLFAIDTIESRQMKQNKPLFLQQVISSMKHYEQTHSLKISAVEQMNKLQDVVNTMSNMKKLDKIVNRPLFWIWGLFYNCVLSDQPLKYVDIVSKGKKSTHDGTLPVYELTTQSYERLVYLMLLHEMFSRDIGDENSNYVAAVLSVCRWPLIQFSLNENPNASALINSSTFDSIYKLYSTSENVDSLIDVDELSKRRMYEIRPEYMDKTTNRGRGKNTMEAIVCLLEHEQFSDWSLMEKELSRSHGYGVKYAKKSSSNLSPDAKQSMETCNFNSMTLIEQYLGQVMKLKETQVHLLFSGDEYLKNMSELLLVIEKQFTMTKTKFKYILELMRIELMNEGLITMELELTNYSALYEVPPPKNGETFNNCRKKIFMSFGNLQKQTEFSNYLPFAKQTTQPQQLLEDTNQDTTMQSNTDNKSTVQWDNENAEASEEPSTPTPKKRTAKKVAIAKATKKVESDNDDTEPESSTPSKKRAAPKKKTPAPKKKKVSKLCTVDSKYIDLLNKIATPIDLSVNLDDATLVYRPTNNAKKLLVMHEDSVYKGPYTLGENDVTSLFSILYRHNILHNWNDETIYKHELIKVVDLTKPESTLKFYIRMPNYAAPLDNDLVEKRTVTDSLNTHEKQTVKIFSPMSYGLVYIKQLYKSNLFDELLFKTVNSLVHRYLLGIGDSHFDNFVVNLRSDLIQLDIDDKRKTTTTLAAYREDGNTEKPTWDNVLFVKKSTVSMDDIITGLKDKASFIASVEKQLNFIKSQPDSSYLREDQYYLDGFLCMDELKERIETIEALVEELKNPTAQSDDSSTNSSE